MLKIAFAGFRHGHINGLYAQAQEHPGVEIIAAWEGDAEARAAARRDLGVNFTHDSYEAMLAAPGLDVVAIGDYFGARGAEAIAALKAGKHVIVDKPLCTSLAELDEIEALAAKTGLKVGCMLDLRFAQWVQPVRRFLREGKLGAVHGIQFTGQHPLNYGSRPAWYYEEGKHGGTINDIAVHGIDMVTYLTGLRLEKVLAARCWNAFAKAEPRFNDSAQFMVQMDNGAGLMADVSYASPTGIGWKLPTYWRFNLWGEKGMMEFGSNVTPQVTVYLDHAAEPLVMDVSGEPSQKILDVFLDELAGKPTDLHTQVVFQTSRDTLLVQQAADRCGA